MNQFRAFAIGGSFACALAPILIPLPLPTMISLWLMVYLIGTTQ